MLFIIEDNTYTSIFQINALIILQRIIHINELNNKVVLHFLLDDNDNTYTSKFQMNAYACIEDYLQRIYTY